MSQERSKSSQEGFRNPTYCRQWSQAVLVALQSRGVSPDNAHDFVQEALVRAIACQDAGVAIDNHSGFLWQIALRLFLTSRRSACSRRERQASAEFEAKPMAEDRHRASLSIEFCRGLGEDTDSRIHKEQLAEKLALLNLLPAPERWVLEQTYLHGVPLAASAVAVGPSASASNLSRLSQEAFVLFRELWALHENGRFSAIQETISSAEAKTNCGRVAIRRALHSGRTHVGYWGLPPAA